MARVSVEGSEVVVLLGLAEMPAARRRTVRFPVAALREVGVETSWWRVLRGEADRGRWLPGRCVAVRHGPDGTDFVALRADGPVLWMDLAPEAPKTRERPVREGRGVRSCGDPLRPACYGLTGSAGVKIAGTLHCCAGVPLQSNSWNSVPQLRFAQGTSRQRPDCGL